MGGNAQAVTLLSFSEHARFSLIRFSVVHSCLYLMGLLGLQQGTLRQLSLVVL